MDIYSLKGIGVIFLIANCIFQTSPIKTKSPARRLNFNIPTTTESRAQNTNNLHPPKVTKHYKRHEFMSSLAERRYTAPPNQVGLQLKSVLGYNGNGRKNMVWKYDTGNNNSSVWSYTKSTSLQQTPLGPQFDVHLEC